MKKLIIKAFVVIAVIVCIGCHHKGKQAVESISLKDLNTHPVIGELGIPMGEVATVRASVVDGNSTRMKEHQDEFLLRITSVNGKDLVTAPLMPFASAIGTEVEGIDSMWVGKSITLEAYEAGEFSGVPEHLPDHWPIWAGGGYSLRTHLNILSWPEE
jgi:hypothetical protein